MANIIVVGVDGSDTAMAAARTAARLAADTGAALHIVCAFEKDAVTEVVGEGTDRWLLSTAGQAENSAREASELFADIVAPITCQAVLDRPADALISEAKRLDAKLIVVGNKRMQGLARVLGSVAAAVAHHAPCDVYVAHTT